MKRLLGFLLVGIGLIGAFVETSYFGNNVFAQSSGEVIADIICFGLSFIGYYLISTSVRHQKL